MREQRSRPIWDRGASHTTHDEPLRLQVMELAADSSAPSNFAPPASYRFTQQYAELRRAVVQERLLEKQPVYYACKILLNFCLLGLGLTMLLLYRNSWLQLLNAGFLGFVFTQMGFIVHDAGHKQVLDTGWKNDLIGILHANLLLGFSYTRWVIPHNKHHSTPNQLGVDPDIGFRVFAFTQAQARKKRGVLRWIAKYQAYWFFPFLSFEAVNLKGNHIRFLLRSKVRYGATETVCVALHMVLYFGLLFLYLSFSHAVAFIVVNQAVFGLYLGMVIAPNHFGMPLLDQYAKVDFLSQQVLTARNIRRHRITDYCFGPLRCQIEHHLFPNMPLNKLREAQKIVRPYCEAEGITYHETGLLQAYGEILNYLHQVSAPLRSEA